MAVAFCRNEISKYKEILANGERLSQSAEDTAQTGSISFGETNDLDSIIVPTGGTIDLSIYNSNSVISITGSPASQNNGNRTILHKFAQGNGSTRLVFVGIRVFDIRTDPSITVQQVGDLTSAYVASMNTYTGTSTQTADSLIEAEESDVPGFRGTAYVVLQNVRKDLLGGGIPQFSAIIEEDAAKTLDEAITDVMTESGYQASEYDVTDLSLIVFRGFAYSGLNTPRSILNAFVTAYTLNRFDRDSKIIFQRKSSAQTVSVDNNYLNASTADETGNSPALVSDAIDVDVPSRVEIHYLSPTLNYQESVASDQLNVTFFTRTEQVELPIVLTDSEARDLAQLTLWRLHNERLTINMTIGFRYAEIHPGDSIQVTILSQQYTARVEKINRGKDFVLEVEAVVEDSDTFNQSSVTDGLANFVKETLPLDQSIATKIVQIPAVFDQDVLDPVLYYAVFNATTDQDFLGVEVYESSDSTNWKLKTSTANDHVFGVCDTTLATIANHHVIDNVNTLRVTVQNGTLQSVSLTRVLEDRENMALVGSEIIYFTTATLVSANQYDLTGLIRGARNTEEFISTHVADEDFVLLNSNAQDDIARLPLTFADRGRPRVYAVVGLGSGPEQAEPITITPSLLTLRPFSVTDINATRDGSNNLTIGWKRRSRAFGSEFVEGGVPLVDDVEEYDVEILDAPGGNVIRTFEGNTTPFALYTAAAQTADGLTPGDPVDVKIYQVSPIYHRGKALEATV
jgi:hypothetical protein